MATKKERDRAHSVLGDIKKHPIVSSIAAIYLFIVPFIRLFGDVSDAIILSGYISSTIVVMASGPVQYVGGVFVALCLSYIFQDRWYPLYERGKAKVIRWNRERKNPFVIRPIPGADPRISIRRMHEKPLTGLNVSARLAIRNNSRKVLKRCSVQLVDALPLLNGYIVKSANSYPSVCSDRGESFLLKWSESEPSIDGKFLDIRPDRAEHLVHILRLNTDTWRADFASANLEDMTSMLTHIGKGMWFQLRIRISAEDGTSVMTQWVAACGSDPGPITLDYWDPRGERILAEQRKKPAP